MKNLLRARIAQLAGIIALVAVIGFFMTACGDDPPADPPAGYVTLRASSFGPYVGETLTAEYDGDEVVYFSFWKEEDRSYVEAGTLALSDDGAVQDISATATWTPLSAGTYFAAVVDKAAWDAYELAGDETKPAPQFTCSSSVTVTVFPFFGTWLMNGPQNNWRPQASITDPHNETITITKTQFKLDSTYKPATSNPQDQFEHVYWTITSWEEITGADLTVSTPGLPATAGGHNTTATNVTYAKGYKLNVTETEDFGYDVNYNTSGFKIYLLESDATASIRMRRDNGTGATILPRVYVKQ